MARIDVPEGPGGDAAMIWSLRPELGGMVQRMVKGAYEQSIIPGEERELARMRIAEINACSACADFRADSIRELDIPDELYANVSAWSSYPGYTERQRLAIEYAERFALAHDRIDDDLYARLRASFTDAEVLDLTLCIGVFLGLGRTLAVLHVEQACAVPL